MQKNKSNLQENLTTKVEQTKERCKILHVEWNGIDDILNISLINYGKINLKIVDIYVNGYRVYYYHGIFPINIPTSEISQISFTSPVSISENELYDIVIISGRGGSNEYQLSM
jgi:hypothetical protein